MLLELAFAATISGLLSQLTLATATEYGFEPTAFAAHLIPPSYVQLVMIQLRFVAKKLIILTPHKRPQLLPEWGWKLTDEFVYERIRARLYIADEY
ncbi:unnamed protein product [Adineta steineri]|uniref:Uncharacterized protein n=1 Tax=Adineta steineri TaxID=433720 RepID=A0A813NMK9_9BILA|nr:unnamed protein product [Adineta steineri]